MNNFGIVDIIITIMNMLTSSINSEFKHSDSYYQDYIEFNFSIQLNLLYQEVSLSIMRN